MKNKSLPGAHWYSYVFLYGLLKPILFVYFHLFQNVHFKRNGFRVPKGPVFFIGNHHTNWDGFYHAVRFYWRFPHYIVHDEAFKNRVYGWIIGEFLGQIKRARNIGEVEPIRQLKRLVTAGQSVNVYPEGDIHMFGGTLPIDDSIAKMAQLLDVPVVLTRVRGAHLRAPRWSNKAHHSRITYEISDVIMREDVRNTPIANLHERIVSHITVNAYDDQMVERIRLHGGRRAEWLELGLFYCPACQQFETLVSRGNHFVCLHCGLIGFVNRYLELEIPSIPSLKRPDVFDQLQQQALTTLIASARSDAHLFTLSNGRYEVVAKDQYFSKKCYHCYATLSKDQIEIQPINLPPLIIKMNEIEAVELQYKDVLEIVSKEKRYRLSRKTPKWSAYLWVTSLRFIKGN